MGKYDIYKESILHYSSWLRKHGYFGTFLGTGGNVSVKTDSGDVFVITPAGKPYETLNADDMCVMDFDMKQLEGTLSPSVEALLHMSIYLTRGDVNSVVHTHQTYASVLAVTATPLPALFDEVMFSIGEVVEVVPYALSGSPDLVTNVVTKLGNLCNCYFMQNHGALCLGENLEKACLNAELLEKAAMIYCLALGTGREISNIPEPILSGLREIRREMIRKTADANEARRKSPNG